MHQKNPESKLGQRVGATQGDLDKVRQMYNCYKKEVPYGSPEWFFEQWQKFFEDKNHLQAEQPPNKKEISKKRAMNKLPIFINRPK